MAVIREGLEATHKVDYDAPEFSEDESQGRAEEDGTTPRSRPRCAAIAAPASAAGFLDPQYYDDVLAGPFRDGTIADAPVLPGIGMFMPAGSAAAKDKGLFRRNVPEFKADLCTGCMECALVCPDAAIPNAVHDIHELLDHRDQAARHRARAAGSAARPGAGPERSDPRRLSSAARTTSRSTRSWRRRPQALDVDNATLKRNFGKLAAALSVLSGGADAAVLRRDGKEPARHRRSVFGQRRSVEVLGLSRMYRRLRPRRAGRSRAGRSRCWNSCRRGSNSSAARRTRRRASPTARPARAARPSG